MAADNRNFADVLDIQGTEVCIADKKLAETSSETGVQTTDYVLLQDTDGAYHKILKSNFTEAIRNTLAGLLVNNDKGTSVNQIPAIASGDLGSVTPANLASVLGAQDNNGWSIFLPGVSGGQIYKVTDGGSTSRSYVYEVTGCGQNSTSYTVDVRIRNGGNSHEGVKGVFHTISDSSFKVFYRGLLHEMYFQLSSYCAVRIISSIPMQFEPVASLPEDVTQIVLT